MSFFLALTMALALVPVARRVGLAVGLVDTPGNGLKIHKEPVPLSGGIAVVLCSFVAQIVLGGEFVPAVAAAIVLALGTGVADDLRGLRAWVRMAVLGAAGASLAASEVAAGLGAPVALAVILLVLAMANAVNLMDGQDGLAGGLVAVASLGLAVIAAHAGAMLAMESSLALGGALLGFLVWNRPPARIFLGNGGAYAMGVLLAYAAVEIIAVDGWRGLLAAGICLSVFAFEISLTVLRRLLTRTSVVSGDRLHSYDLLAEASGDRTKTTLVFWALGGAVAALSVFVALMPTYVGVVVVLAAVCSGSLLLGSRLLVFRGRRRRSPRPSEERTEGPGVTGSSEGV